MVEKLLDLVTLKDITHDYDIKALDVELKNSVPIGNTVSIFFTEDMNNDKFSGDVSWWY